MGERPSDSDVPRSMEVAPSEGKAAECPAPKKRALTPPSQLQFKAKSEIKEALSAINDSIKQINDRLTRIEHNEESVGARLQKIEAYLNDTVVPAMVKIYPNPLAEQGRSHTNTKINDAISQGPDGLDNQSL